MTILRAAIAAICLVQAGTALAVETPTPAELMSVPPDGLAYFKRLQMGRRLYAADRFAEAEPHLRWATEQYPADGETWLQLARTERRLGKWAEAVGAYKRAIDLVGTGYPGNARYWLAASYAKLGDKDAAFATLRELVFDDGSVERPDLYDDENFASLKSDPRLAEIAGVKSMEAFPRAEGWRADLDFLVEELKRNNPHLKGGDLPAAFRQLFANTYAQVSVLSDEQLYARLSELIATLRQGHSGLWPARGARLMSFTQLPVHFYFFPEGLFVTAADQANQDLAGGRVIAIDGTPIDVATRRMLAIAAREGDMQLLWTGPSHLHFAQLLKGLGLARRTDRIELTVELSGGRRVKRRLTTVPLENFEEKLGPPPRVAPPLSLSRVGETHWFTPITDADALYVQVNQIAPDKDESLEAFGERLRRQMVERPVRNIILDLRRNNGGNSLTYTSLLRALVGFSLPPENRLFVLVGRNVYSAATNLTTDLERLARPIFVGEATGQGGNQDGDASAIRLPYSGITLAAPGVRWQLSTPWDGRRAKPVHVPVQLTARSYFAGRDDVLEAALTLIGSP